MLISAKEKVDDLLGEFRNLTSTIQRALGVEENKFDIVVSGGGFKGQYAGGVLSILTLLEKEVKHSESRRDATS